MNFKRKKCKRHVKCTICTPYRWMGNSLKQARVKDLKEAYEVSIL